jgi:hypothetical protein
MSSHRLWNVVVHRHEDVSFTARVWVDGKLLLPECVGCPAAAALAYVEEALVDVRAADQLALRAQGSGGIRTFRASHSELALRWLDECMQAEGAKTGTHSIVRRDACPDSEDLVSNASS